jgi:ubiquinone/menaquinone biosynthesis C-methylase UbiE
VQDESVARTLREAWDAQPAEWARFVRTPGHDLTNEAFNLPRLLDLLPPPGRRTLDLGCGEGRVGRALIPLGHRVVGVDASPGMVALAAESQEALVADASALPFEDGAFDLVVAFMSLMDMDEPDAAIAEAARVLEPGGHLCFCITHPFQTAGRFDDRRPESPFVITGSYLEERRIEDDWERDRIRIRFAYTHRPLGAWCGGLASAGLLVEALREHPLPRDIWRDEGGARWTRIPLFLHMRAVKPR